MKKLGLGLSVLFMLVTMIGACPVPGCQYVGDCTTWHLTSAAAVDSGHLHVIGSATVGDIVAGNDQTGRFMAVLDGEFFCTLCGTDDTTYTGTLLQDNILPSGTSPIDFIFPADTTVPHTITLYLGQTNCANCSQTFVIHTYPYYNPPDPVWLQMWMCKDGSACFNGDIKPGPDGGCWTYDFSGDIIPMSTAAKLCPNTGTMTPVYFGWVTLPAPGISECWGDSKDANLCNHAGDIILAAINKANHWHLTVPWFFKGYGGH